MYPRVTLIVFWHSRAGNVLNLRERRDRCIQFKPRKVCGKYQHAAGPDQTKSSLKQGDMVTLYIQRLAHPLGIGEGWGVEENQVPTTSRGVSHPLKCIRLNENVLTAGKTIQV
jgi:hypothetical protein